MNNDWTIPRMIHWSTPEETRKSWDRRVPYHVRFRDYFASLIETSSLRPGGKLPSERDLSNQFSINRVTVRQALSRMETEGLIFREERRGWFVSPQRIYYDPTANTSFTESVSMQGRLAATRILSQQQMSASKPISALLDCTIGDPVYVINRLRSVDSRPVLVEQIHIKAKRCPGLLDFPLDQSMTDLMTKEFGIVEHRTQINMRPTALPEIPAKTLGVVVGTPGLYISRAILDQFNEVIELDQQFWRHDAIDVGISATNDPQQPNPKQT